jgi:endoglucanase
MLSGPMSSWVDGLPASLAVNDPNVVYTIHIYDPFAFTHQGADWVVDPGLTAALGIPFPATPQACATAIANQPTTAAAEVVTEYCSHGYDAAWVRGRIETAAAWAASHDAAMFIGEFGVSPTASVDDAARWFAAVANAAEEFGMGWAIWSIDSAMGIRRSNAWTTSLSDTPDPALLAALGLHVA